MTELRFFKESVLPTNKEPDALYFILNGDYAETYLTDSNGVAKMIGNTTMITQIAGTNQQEVQLVSTIADRDALNPEANTTVYVQDASADATVTSGGAFYFYEKATNSHIKLAEFESMDVSLDWNNLQNKPNSTASSIDQAVQDAHIHNNKAILDGLTDSGSGKVITDAERLQLASNTQDSHTHANKGRLDKLGENSNQSLTYDGAPVLKWATNNW